MQKIKTAKLVLIFLPIILACMTTLEPYATYPADPTATRDGISAPTVVPATSTLLRQTQEPIQIQIQPVCAIVTADEALHIRAGPSETSEVLGYLHNGEVVTVINSIDSWWKIQAGPVQGYSKADYLQEVNCD